MAPCLENLLHALGIGHGQSIFGAKNPKAAVLYGQFVQAAYSMYGAAPNNLTPPPSPDFPAGYNLVAWVQMQDFIIGSTGPTFYGFNPNQFALAIRGTSNGIEWWDDQPRTR